ncbi:MAG TPA: O-antigen ligase family protein [Solirubrobacteraceae bacterium]|nr:O-antigen ligase family protein [Solirubrobacteraceae bacterium]
MSDGVAIGPDAPTAGDTPAADDAPGTRAGPLAVTALMLLPGALVVFTGFNAGGYFPATPAVAAIVVSQILLVRVLQSRNPFEGLAPATLAAIAALGFYALLTLVSAFWSHATGRALIEFDRAWLYLLILVLFGTVRASTEDLRWLVRGLLMGASIVCLAGLISRVLPDVWHTAPDVSNQRLSFPVTYWNTLGLLAALGIVLAFHLTCTLGERRLYRILAAAVLPLLAATLFFTFSRGAMAAGAIGLVVYILVARPRGLLSGVLATAPATVALIVVAYHANLLDTVRPTTPAAVSQGHRVALAAALCVAACAGLRLLFAAGLDPRLRRIAGTALISRQMRLAAIAGALVAVLVTGLALGVPHSLANDWSRFISGAATHGRHDLRQRLTDPSNDGRTDLWRVAVRGFEASPVHGHGAGMYQTLWERNRPHFAFTINAHSLYLQAMAELGIPGLLLLLVLVGAVLCGLSVRTRGPQRSLYGALLACGVVWALRAGVDWDWEMPVVTLIFFAVAGAALNPRKESASGRGWVPGYRCRLILGLLCLASVALGVLIISSQVRLGDAEHALYASNCTKAAPAARSSIGWLDVRPEPYEILGFCDLQRGLPRQGVSAMRQAVHHDPGSWETYYTLAIAQAASGIDPRAAATRALRMNPFEPLTKQEAKEFQTPSPTGWVKRSAIVRAAALASNDLSIVPS